MSDISIIDHNRWGWVVVFGAFVSHFLTCGYEKGYSILYVEIIEKFHTSAAFAAGLGGVSSAVRLFLAPVSVVLCNKFNEQKVVMFGGTLCFLGLVSCALVTSLHGFAIGYGIIFGFGLTLVYTPSLTICTSYFKVRRSTAISISLAGCGLATITMPYLIVFLIDEYTFDGAMLLLAAIGLHYSVVGALFRELSTSTPSLRIAEVKIPNGSNEKTSERVRRFFRSKCCSASFVKTLRNPWLMLFLFSFCFNMMGSGPVTTLLIHHTENLGYKRIMSVQLLAIEGVTQIFIRVLTGFIFDHSRVKTYRGLIWCSTISLSALVILCLAFVNTLWLLSVLMCLRGITMAIYISQQAVIAADLCERAPGTLKETIGLMQIGKGVGVLFGSWCAGTIRDTTNAYQPAFIFLGLMQFVGSLAATTAVIFAMRRTRQEHLKRRRSSSYYSVSTVPSETSININTVSKELDHAEPMKTIVFLEAFKEDPIHPESNEELLPKALSDRPHNEDQQSA